MSMWEVKASSLVNVYLSKKYSNMPDSTTKRSLLKRFQVFEQKVPKYCENSRLTIEAIELKAQEEETSSRHKYLFLLRYQNAIISDKNTGSMLHICR